MLSQPLLERVALVTGGARGIGRAIVEQFASAGAHVAFTYLSSEAAAEELVGSLSTQEHRLKAYRSDAADYTAAEQLVAQVVKDFERLDILVNNAGITKDGLLLRMPEAAWDEVQAANLKSCFNLSRHAARQFLRQRKGNIINISSVVGQRGNPGQANYVASKAGIIGLTKAIAQELGTIGVRCNAVAPGFIQTAMTEGLDEKNELEWKKMIPLQRFGQPDDVASACVFLASDAAAYITGHTLNVNGGML